MSVGVSGKSQKRNEMKESQRKKFQRIRDERDPIAWRWSVCGGEGRRGKVAAKTLWEKKDNEIYGQLKRLIDVERRIRCTSIYSTLFIYKYVSMCLIRAQILNEVKGNEGQGGEGEEVNTVG